MTEPINRELLKGSLDLLILRVLEGGPLYGYRIVREVQARSGDVLRFREGSLYPALHRLEGLGWLEGFWQARPDGVERRYYRLTEAGRDALARKRAEWERFTSAVRGVLGYETP